MSDQFPTSGMKMSNLHSEMPSEILSTTANSLIYGGARISGHSGVGCIASQILVIMVVNMDCVTIVSTSLQLEGPPDDDSWPAEYRRAG